MDWEPTITKQVNGKNHYVRQEYIGTVDYNSSVKSVQSVTTPANAAT